MMLWVLEERQDLCGAQGAIVDSELVDLPVQEWVGVLRAADPIVRRVAQITFIVLSSVYEGPRAAPGPERCVASAGIHTRMLLGPRLAHA